MKKNLFVAALLCSISFAGNAATNEAKNTPAEKKTAASVELVQPLRVKLLYMMDFHCAAQGWTIPVVGRTPQEMTKQYQYYVDHLAC